MRDPHDIIRHPHVTEKTVALSMGDARKSDDDIVRKYTFIVAKDANKIEIKAALEAIYNAGVKKEGNKIQIDNVRTMVNKGKFRRVGQKSRGKKPDFKKAIVTLAKGQLLEDFGV